MSKEAYVSNKSGATIMHAQRSRLHTTIGVDMDDVIADAQRGQRPDME